MKHFVIIIAFGLISVLSCTINAQINDNEAVMNFQNQFQIEIESISAIAYQDTAIWVDGKVYQFIKVQLNIDSIQKTTIDDFKWGTGIFSISYDASNSRETITKALYPIKMQSDTIGLFLMDDFRNNRIYEHNYHTITYIINSETTENSVYHYWIGLKFDKENFQNYQSEFPEATEEWYEKWKNKSKFEGERERNEIENFNKLEWIGK